MQDTLKEELHFGRASHQLILPVFTKSSVNTTFQGEGTLLIETHPSLSIHRCWIATRKIWTASLGLFLIYRSAIREQKPFHYRNTWYSISRLPLYHHLCKQEVIPTCDRKVIRRCCKKLPRNSTRIMQPRRQRMGRAILWVYAPDRIELTMPGPPRIRILMTSST